MTKTNEIRALIQLILLSFVLPIYLCELVYLKISVFGIFRFALRRHLGLVKIQTVNYK